jgi:hypothetical protein
MCPDLHRLTTALGRVRIPVTDMQAPVVTCLSSSSGKAGTSATICILLMVEPSFRAINAMFLLPLRVRTQPFTVISLLNSVEFNASLTFVLLFMLMWYVIDPENLCKNTLFDFISSRSLHVNLIARLIQICVRKAVKG